jgi:hypothetical protein
LVGKTIGFLLVLISRFTNSPIRLYSQFFLTAGAIATTGALPLQ